MIYECNMNEQRTELAVDNGMLLSSSFVMQ
jgi:hypothetical protein